VPFFYVVLLLVRYLTQRIVGLFNTPLRFFAEGQSDPFPEAVSRTHNEGRK
jgi:hypothetical protein